MSQIEQDFRVLLSKNPEIEKCFQEGLINRRALARYLIKKGIAKSNQMEATVAMLRRFPFRTFPKEEKKIFKDMRIHVKDKILILDFHKEKAIMQRLQKLIGAIDYDKGDTLKIVLGTTSVKVIMDESKEAKLQNIFSEFSRKKRISAISELSCQFPSEVLKIKGTLSTITREFLTHDIVITELLTNTPELLIYVKEEYVLKAYEILKRLQK